MTYGQLLAWVNSNERTPEELGKLLLVLGIESKAKTARGMRTAIQRVLAKHDMNEPIGVELEQATGKPTRRKKSYKHIPSDDGNKGEKPPQNKDESKTPPPENGGDGMDHPNDPKPVPPNVVEANGLKTPIIGVLKRYQRSEITVESAIDELRRIAKIAMTAAARAVLEDLLKRFVDRNSVETQTYQSFELEVMEIAREYPAKSKEDFSPPPPSKGNNTDKKPDPKPIEPDAGNNNPSTNGRVKTDDRDTVVYANGSRGNNGLYALLGVVALAILGLIVALVIFNDDGDSSSNSTASASSEYSIVNNGKKDDGVTTSNGGNSANNSVNNNGGKSQLLASSNSGQPASCPSDGEMQKAFGFDKMNPPIKPVSSGNDIAWEGCKWQLQWTGPGSLSIQMLKGWEFTATMADNSVVVWYGDGTTRDIKGATMRYLPSYTTSSNSWVQDGCTLLRKEAEFGNSRNPSYDTLSGNVCANGVSQMPPSDSPSTTAATSAGQCPITSQEAAKLLSGGMGTWKDNGVDGSGVHKWILEKTGVTVDLKYPGFGSFDHWSKGNGYKADIPGATDATFNCS